MSESELTEHMSMSDILLHIEEGSIYNFHCTDGTVYKNSVYLTGDALGLWLQIDSTSIIGRVFIAAHELAGVEVV